MYMQSESEINNCSHKPEVEKYTHLISHLVSTIDIVLLNNTIIIEYDLDLKILQLKRQKIPPHPRHQMVLHHQMDLHIAWVLKISTELFY
jgi:hypothetical protein